MAAIETNGDAFKGLQPIATSYYGCGGDASLVQSIHLKWDAVLAAVITFETCNLPPEEVPANTAGVAGDWVQENPSSAYIGVSPAGAGTVANMTITIPAGTAGGAVVHVGNLGSKRIRAKVVATVAGVLRIRANGKE